MNTATETADSVSITPPYVAFKTFKSFIKMLSANGVPSEIDKSMMDGMSGSTQSQLSATLRFLGLVDPVSYTHLTLPTKA